MLVKYKYLCNEEPNTNIGIIIEPVVTMTTTYYGTLRLYNCGVLPKTKMILLSSYINILMYDGY